MDSNQYSSTSDSVLATTVVLVPGTMYSSTNVFEVRTTNMSPMLLT